MDNCLSGSDGWAWIIPAYNEIHRDIMTVLSFDLAGTFKIPVDGESSQVVSELWRKIVFRKFLTSNISIDLLNEF